MALVAPLMFACWIVIFISSGALAQNFCSNVKSAVKHAIEEFVPLRGDFDFDNKVFKSRITFFPAEDCEIDSKQGVSTIKCEGAYPSMDEAKTAFNAYVNNISLCLGAEVKRQPKRSERATYFTHIETDDEISVHLIALTGRSRNRPDLFFVSVEVTHVDPR